MLRSAAALLHKEAVCKTLAMLHTHPSSVSKIGVSQHTLTVRCTPRPYSCSLTSASTASHQVVTCIATVGCCLSKCCSTSVTNLAIGWNSHSTTVHSCQNEEYNNKHMYLAICSQSTKVYLLLSSAWHRRETANPKFASVLAHP